MKFYMKQIKILFIFFVLTLLVTPFSSKASLTFSGSEITGDSALTINGGADTDLLFGSNFGIGNIVIGGAALDPDDGYEGNIFIGDRVNNSSIYIGKTVEASIVDIGSGDASTNVGIGYSNVQSDVSIGNGATTGTSIINLGNGGGITGDYTINMLSGGSTSGLQTVNIMTGINSAGTAQVLNLGTGASRRTISIGNSTGATSVSIQAGTGNISIGTNTVAQSINIGTGNAVKTITVGTSGGLAGTASLNLRAGLSGRITLKGHLYTEHSFSQTTATQNAGTPTLDSFSNDTAGHVATDTTAHTSITITFGNPYDTIPLCTVNPGDADAAAIVGSATGMYVTTTVNDMTINHASSSVIADWNYFCTALSDN